ncbi:MAG: 23S rRNA (adenine(2503)-C(2))-methyltransferase RlmN [FCB group bacterium]|nr:23S rRNA (adenine(2503)-C(2))-methyltransferase RlmN [FCB group bacterium]MBL7028677.1 23S rRNA (adenine(2503)-C(2))-methyltransferase RlmN [Candidatus Neomarinimicrobiota bacterium]MBL7121749.1 23S rRNA (adenine(2503)-C(2))-methyltransferase RlmN [Candidatus Neomarinimicrobiota bacterium]
MFHSSARRVFSCMDSGKIILKNFSQSEMEEWVQSLGHKAFRGRQLFQWIWEKGVESFSEMTNLSKDFIQELETKSQIELTTVHQVQTSESQGTSKFLVRLGDGKFVEAVLIPESKRATVCLSSQVGCALDCDFCATGKMGLKRNLTSGEIADQLLHVRRFSDRPITNIVFMGMGEPFHNYDQVIRASDILNSESGFAHGARKITISTSGMVPQIRRFADEGHRYKLAVSLNASDDESRTQIMPINKKWDIAELVKACKYYTELSKNMLTFEYVLMQGVNDGLGDARRLLKIANQVFCKVNVIPYNEVAQGYLRPSKKRINSFLEVLEGARFGVTIRWSQGDDIDAACGQLSTAAVSEN